MLEGIAVEQSLARRVSVGDEPVVRFHGAKVWSQSCSTLSRAQFVLRRNLRVDLMEGSFAKQRMRMRSASSSQPYSSTREVIISSSFTP